MTFRVRTTNTDGQTMQLAVIKAEKGYTELRVSENDGTETYAEASILLNAEQWREVASAATDAAQHSMDFTDLTYLNQEAVRAVIAAKREEERQAAIVNLRTYVGKTKGWTMLGYKDEEFAAELVEQDILRSEPWAIDAKRTVYKLTEKGQKLHDEWWEKNRPVVPVTTAPTAASKTYTAGTSSTSPGYKSPYTGPTAVKPAATPVPTVASKSISGAK